MQSAKGMRRCWRVWGHDVFMGGERLRRRRRRVSACTGRRLLSERGKGGGGGRALAAWPCSPTLGQVLLMYMRAAALRRQNTNSHITHALLLRGRDISVKIAAPDCSSPAATPPPRAPRLCSLSNLRSPNGRPN